jgi:hypothetical protein
MDFGPKRKQKKLTAVGISVQDLGNVFFVAASGLWKRDVDETKIRWPTVRADISDAKQRSRSLPEGVYLTAFASETQSSLSG